jgi:citrate synthase
MTNTVAASVELKLPEGSFQLPITVGSEGEKAIDISNLRAKTGYITLDNGFMNTGSCSSAITFIDGDRGILRYRGIPIEQVAEKSTFLECAYLLLYGRLPKDDELADFVYEISRHTLLDEDIRRLFEGFPRDAHPMAQLSSAVCALSTFYQNEEGNPEDIFDLNCIRLMAKIPTLIAFAYKRSAGRPVVYPDNSLSYCENFLNMMFALPVERYALDEDLVRALDLLLILHADHEQNCSTSTVRVVRSSMANLYASVAAGICALWGPRHGGANQEVLEMLQAILDSGGNVKKCVEMAKTKDSGFRLMGFGHRVYKNFDPRAKIIKAACDKLLDKLKVRDPLLDIARELEEAALKDPYFVERKLYPNVDFYSGIIYKTMGIPVEYFTTMFALGRLPGWLAHARELDHDPANKIGRPRQVYTGPTLSEYVPVEKRG